MIALKVAGIVKSVDVMDAVPEAHRGAHGETYFLVRDDLKPPAQHSRYYGRLDRNVCN